MLPNFVIIGAMKSGTSSLQCYLSLHPEVFMSSPKELDFFDTHYDNGIDWYASHFATDLPARGEATTNYTKYPLFDQVPQRMHEVIPDAKLIYILRDPVYRILSHYIHSYAEGFENRSLSQILENLDDNHYVRCSSYHMQLQQFIPFYPMSRILILEAEDLRERRAPTLRKVFSFLEVDPHFECKEFNTEFHQSGAKRRKGPFEFALKNNRLYPWLKTHAPTSLLALGKQMGRSFIKPDFSEDELTRLCTRLAPDVQALRETTGHQFPDWVL